MSSTAARTSEHLSLAVTPLSPVHIGCGEDFLPTNYVIEDQYLYAFDPVKLPLTAQDRQHLIGCVNRPGEEGILATQRFFADRAQQCMAVAGQIVAVAPGVAQEYQHRVGQTAMVQGTGQRVINQLEIARCVYQPHTGVPYLPGSSIKGAIRTAWLNKLNNGAPLGDARNAAELERHLLGGAFHKDPFRFLLIGDAQGDVVETEIVFSTSHPKRVALTKDGRSVASTGPTTRLEAIVAGQYAAWSCQAVVHRPSPALDSSCLPDRRRWLPGWRDIARACNDYYLPRLRSELDLLDERQFSRPEWTQQMRQLLDSLEPVLATGNAVLLRVGRHSGFENVTLDGVRRLKSGAQEAKELRLAARLQNARSDMLPFGWVLLHRADQALPALQAWCAGQPKPDTQAVRQRQLQLLAQLEAQRAALEQAEAQRQAALAREQQAAAQEAARLAALSPQGREVEALRAKLQSHTAARKQPISGQLYQLTRALIQRAEQDDQWTAPDKAALAELLITLVPEKIDLGGKAKEIRQAAQRLSTPT
jgi:CRISPR-associated protein Csm5